MNTEYQVLCLLEHRHLRITVSKLVLPCAAGNGGQWDSAGIHGEHLIGFGGLEFPSGSG